MHTRSSDTTVKLRHIPELKVLLCEGCGYCVLSRALDRHLKDIHSLRSSQRRQHLRTSKQLALVDSSDISYPEPGRQPIPGLPILNGYACEAAGCKHLCATRKRMEAHWGQEHDAHGRSSAELLTCRPAKIQTLFRGNLLRYFEVSNGTSRDPTSSPADGPARGLGLQSSPPSGVRTVLEWRLVESFIGEGHLGLLPTKGARQSWRDQMLQVSASVDYLRLAILSAVASRIAFEFPETRQYYGAAADKYRLTAIRALPDMSTLSVKESFFQLFHFSRLMTMCCIARVQSRYTLQDEEYHNLQLEEPLLPEWVPVQRQGRALTWQFRGQDRIANALHGPPQRLRPLYPIEELGFMLNPYDDKLEELAACLTVESTRPVDPACLEALDLLRHVWSLPYRDDLCGFRDMALMWTARISQEYIDLLQDRDAASVVVFAYYCVLWSLAEEQYWYMHGHAERMLLRAYQCLSWEWQGLLEWPGLMIWGSQINLGPVTTAKQIEAVPLR